MKFETAMESVIDEYNKAIAKYPHGFNSYHEGYGVIKEEFDELSEAIKIGKKEKISEEFGDLLFSLVNVSRFLDIDAEDSLRQTIEKFMKRLKNVEKIIKNKGSKDLKNYTLNELDEIWEDVKRKEKKDE